MSWVVDILMFLPICFITSVVCTVIKKDEGEKFWGQAIRMFVMLAVGITLFCVLIYAVTVLAGSEFSPVPIGPVE